MHIVIYMYVLDVELMIIDVKLCDNIYVKILKKFWIQFIV